MGIGFGGTPSGMRIDVVDIANDGKITKSVIHMPIKLTKRFRGLRLGPDGELYAAAIDEGEIYKITAESNLSVTCTTNSGANTFFFFNQILNNNFPIYFKFIIEMILIIIIILLWMIFLLNFAIRKY